MNSSLVLDRAVDVTLAALGLGLAWLFVQSLSFFVGLLEFWKAKQVPQKGS